MISKIVMFRQHPLYVLMCESEKFITPPIQEKIRFTNRNKLTELITKLTSHLQCIDQATALPSLS